MAATAPCATSSAEFRGLVRTDVRAQILDDVGAARMSLREFFAKGKIPARAEAAVLNAETHQAGAGQGPRPARQGALPLGSRSGSRSDTFQYKRALIDHRRRAIRARGRFRLLPGCRGTAGRSSASTGRRAWSILTARSATAYGLDGLLADQRAGIDEPIILALHLASPRIAYTDKAKSALQLPDAVPMQSRSW